MASNQYDRQPVQSIVIELTTSNTGTDKGVEAKLPKDAMITGITSIAGVAFNPSGTGAAATLSVSDGTTTFVNAQDVATTGTKTVAVATKFYPQGGKITANVTQSVSSGALTSATAGRVLVAIDYVQLGAGGAIYG